ncbi:putative DNA-binding transcriptional regulator YafY [Rhizobium sp. PP-F2F-G38]|nr:putative DNA-binding transcriptional regulator YafY [Rhizobium sp. PP-WC-1G-195]PYE39446.1 putative DNA-binding transcriptional regulator YafY [Rhizobium sp. PP-F2F-G20b]PYE92504.1 putative DNA-binding transcriptional regulator YafY [Rhizobium sp. PP-F2F-G38]TCL89085.1 putative DNA-binding transcriptional regulator YafY [Rhizobium sp. PP-WC-2G-219]TCQ03571.1 putative DNA-binding transcriptional regulator YafY [Rhizobium sp. PP-F2F-G36]
MARSHRLFDLMQVLRRHRATVSGQTLANELGVSLRTIRRDVATLQGMGAEIDGEAGVGYILQPGFLLPPLSFTDEEVQALVIGAQWVSRQTDDKLAFAVTNALAKINAVLPPDMRSVLSDDMVYVGHPMKTAGPLDLSEVRRALREQRKLRITLSLAHLNLESAIIWPIMLGLIESKRFIAAWCELDGRFRVIELDDIATAEVLAERYTRSRRLLVKEWRSQEIRPCNSEGEIC